MALHDVIPVGVGLVGCGRIGRMHAELLTHEVPGATLRVVHDVIPAASAVLGLSLGASVASSVEDLVSRPDVDAIAVCSSTDTHLEVIEAAAAAGKAILCEKPLAPDLASVDRALAAVEESGVLFQMGFNRRFDPAHRSVHDAVADAVIGDVHLVRITSRDPAPPPLEYIRVSGGLFLDMTIHDFDMARFVTGSEVVDVWAQGTCRVDPAIGDAGDIDTAVVVLTHENGCLTTIDNSRKAVYGYDQRVEAFGSQGMAASDNPPVHAGRRLTPAGAQTAPIRHFFIDRYHESFVNQWKAFVRMVREGAPSPVTGADGRAPLVIGLACLASMREGRRVSVKEIG